MSGPLGTVTIVDLPVFRRGKVRETFDLGDALLMVATDRISAFDVVLPNLIPDKGRVLTGLSAHWFDETSHIAPNHLISTDLEALPPAARDAAGQLRDRFMIVKKAERIDIECVVRGYLSGSAWAEYRADGTVCGQALARGLVESARLDAPIFTPAIKSDAGHDENISYARMQDLIGTELSERLRSTSLRLYAFAAERALPRGIIIADTKFEFGFVDGELLVIDEMLTPDSSRFWAAEAYDPGRAQASFDKQPVRDWLSASGWDKSPPAPTLPGDVVNATAERYREAYRRIIGKGWDEA
jgi:phosphoribosylaminoimidazole-succinocarboxamide synthase